MPEEVPGSAKPGAEDDLALAAASGLICRAAPTRLAPSGSTPGRSRRWLIVGAIVVAGLLAGASVALAGSGPSAPVHAAPAAAHSASAAPSGGSGQGTAVTG